MKNCSIIQNLDETSVSLLRIRYFSYRNVISILLARNLSFQSPHKDRFTVLCGDTQTIETRTCLQYHRFWSLSFLQPCTNAMLYRNSSFISVEMVCDKRNVAPKVIFTFPIEKYVSSLPLVGTGKTKWELNTNSSTDKNKIEEFDIQYKNFLMITKFHSEKKLS